LHWPSPPKPLSIHGIEIMASEVQRAQSAMGHAAKFTTGDMCKTDFGTADVIVILDVLHYVSIAAQNDVLLRARNALTPGGTLILRVGDASGGLPFKFSVCVDYVASFVRGHRNVRLHCRTLPAWCAALADLGFAIRTLPMNKDTPFANVLLVAKLVQNANL
jgi:2-polyprenyl-3-methyl-5-hydroxy-6-metoxy-1,4-benzoquinol methylase